MSQLDTNHMPFVYFTCIGVGLSMSNPAVVSDTFTDLKALWARVRDKSFNLLFTLHTLNEVYTSSETSSTSREFGPFSGLQ